MKQSSSTIYDVAIVGAGPAGSGAAAALAARGWRVLLVERDRFPRNKVCGEFLSPEAQSALATLGLSQALVALGPIALAEARVISRRGAVLNAAMPAPGWGISRHAMDATLAAAAEQQGATLWQETAVIDCKREEKRQRLTLRRDGETQCLSVGTAILAGGRSLSARVLQRPIQQRAGRLNVGIKAHFAGIEMPDRVEVYLFNGGYVGINPVESGVANVCLLASYAAFAEAGQNPETVFGWIARHNRAFGRRIEDARLVMETLCTVAGVDTGRPGRPWNGVACLGDTAAMIPPLCGDGMAMALHSATLCVPYADAFLRGEIDLSRWEAGYVADWHAAFDSRLRAGRALQAMLNSRASELLLRAGKYVPMTADYFVRATRG